MSVQQRRLTHAEFLSEAQARFGPDTSCWAFRCPVCGDVASAADFRAQGADPALVGQHCLGRELGALRGCRETKDGVTRGDAPRGCDWAAYGLFSGPWFIAMPDGEWACSFPLAGEGV